MLREIQPDAIAPRSRRQNFESRAPTLWHVSVPVLSLAIGIGPTTCWLTQLDKDGAIGVCMRASETEHKSNY